tara:strand:+ start:31 stop:579 length:549 start_codon:yes stop_codon:yes gene_type:complete
MDSISYKGNPLNLCSGTFGAISTSPTNTTTNVIDGKQVDKDNFPMQGNSGGVGGDCYYINDNFVITSFASACLLMAFRGIKVDHDGYPMVPDHVSYKRAIKSYITMMLDRINWRKGTAPEAIYRDSQRDWEWYVKQARGTANMPNLNMMENIKTQWVKLKPNMTSANTFYTDLSSPEQRLVG